LSASWYLVNLKFGRKKDANRFRKSVISDSVELLVRPKACNLPTTFFFRQNAKKQVLAKLIRNVLSQKILEKSAIASYGENYQASAAAGGKVESGV
jgi:hypothetical protein